MACEKHNRQDPFFFRVRVRRIRRSRIHRRHSRSGARPLVVWFATAKSLKAAPPAAPPFSQGWAGGKRKATEPASCGPLKTCSSSHARMCYTTCIGELRRKMACEKHNRQDPFFFRVRIRRIRRSRIHRRHSRSGGAFRTRPAPPPP